VPEGEFIVQIGGSSDKLPLKTEFNLGKTAGKSDLSVKNIRTIPAFPKEGDEVTFLASLINNGTAAVKKGDDHGIRFFVNGEKVAVYQSASTEIPVGGMVLVCARGIKGKNWKASDGTFKITAKIDISENRDLNRDNNICEAELQIPDGKVIPAEIAKILK
jgi:beta-glucosidase